MKNLIPYLTPLLIALCLQGCFVGEILSAPFKVTGAVLNTVTPDVVGDSVSGVGEVVDTVIPF